VKTGLNVSDGDVEVIQVLLLKHSHVFIGD